MENALKDLWLLTVRLKKSPKEDPKLTTIVQNSIESKYKEWTITRTKIYRLKKAAAAKSQTCLFLS